MNFLRENITVNWVCKFCKISLQNSRFFAILHNLQQNLTFILFFLHRANDERSTGVRVANSFFATNFSSRSSQPSRMGIIKRFNRHHRRHPYPPSSVEDDGGVKGMFKAIHSMWRCKLYKFYKTNVNCYQIITALDLYQFAIEFKQIFLRSLSKLFKMLHICHYKLYSVANIQFNYFLIEYLKFSFWDFRD